MGLAIAEKGLGSLEDFVYSRHQMYRQVYAHKTAQGFDWLLRAAIDEVMQQPEIRQYVEQCLSDIKDFKYLTDNYFWEAFRHYASQTPNSYSECILDRIKMPYLGTRTNLSNEEQSTYQAFLAKENGYTKESIVMSSITARFTSIRDEFSDIKVLYKSTSAQPETYKLIANTSQFFAKFTDDRITHFYVDPMHKANKV
jgi:HD superfamily phosphohydrolase